MTAAGDVIGGMGPRPVVYNQSDLAMTDVLFGQSYYLRFDPKLWEAMCPYPPLGTLYACSYARSRGFRVGLFDAMLAESTADWERALRNTRPPVAVIYEDSFNYLSKMCLLRMREAAFEMIGIAKRGGSAVVVSASDATDHVEDYLDAGADYVLIGEGEETLGELLEWLSGDRETPVSEIAGLAAPGFNSPPREVMRELDRLPFPAWDLVDVEKYRDVWLRRHGYYSVNMVTTRGCPYPCNWCAKPIYGRRYHVRSPENVVEEMAWLKRLTRPDHIWFCDDIFGLKPNWIRRFSALCRERGLETPFKCLMRTDLVDQETADDLAKAGCRTVWMGAESGSQKILDAMEKKATVQDTRRATRLLRRAGIEVGYFLQFGYPGEEWEDIQLTLGLVRECMPDDVGVSVSYPLPGTKFHERVRAQLGVQRNWLDSDDLAMLYRGRYTSAFYRQLHRTLHKEFRGRKAWKSLREGDLRAAVQLVRSSTLPLDRLRLQWMRKSSDRTG